MISKLIFPLAFLFLLNASCNKVIEEVPLPPFDVFPNPCKNVCSVVLNNLVFFPGEPVTIRLLKGNETLAESTIELASPPFSFQMNMQDRAAGIYHVELTSRGQTYITPVLKVD